MKKVYYHIYMKKSKEWKIAFWIRYRHYKYIIMLFKLKNVLVIFQRLINNILREYLDDFVIIYLNNILIYSDNLKSHYKHVYKILGLRRLFLHAVQAGNLKGLPFRANRVTGRAVVVAVQGATVVPRRCCWRALQCGLNRTEVYDQTGYENHPIIVYRVRYGPKSTPTRDGCEVYAMLRAPLG